MQQQPDRKSAAKSLIRPDLVMSSQTIYPSTGPLLPFTGWSLLCAPHSAYSVITTGLQGCCRVFLPAGLWGLLCQLLGLHWLCGGECEASAGKSGRHGSMFTTRPGLDKCFLMGGSHSIPSNQKVTFTMNASVEVYTAGCGRGG